MRYSLPENSFFVRNRKNYSAKLNPNSIAVFHSNDQMPRNGDQFFPFRQNSDFYYLTGIDQERSILLLAPGHPDPNMQEILFLIETNEKIAAWEGHKFTQKEASEISGIKNVQWLNDFETILRDMLFWCKNVYVNLYENSRFKTDVTSGNMRFAKKLHNDYPAHRIERSAPFLTQMRMLKQKEEIALIKEAIQITGIAFERMLQFVKPGVQEYKIQAEMEHTFAMNGASGPAFAPIVASGKNACVLHYTKNNDTCLEGDLILFDFGAEYGNYAADISRTIPVNGKFTRRQRDLYNLVLRVQKNAIRKMVPGITLKEYNTFVNHQMEQELIAIGLLKDDEVRNQDPENPLFKKYMMHGPAHHLGLDVHDVFDKHEPFKAGMVLTCEPGIYIRDENTGIRIENNILITDGGPVDLSEKIPREVDDIEDLMNN